jgi:hypothetical protein
MLSFTRICKEAILEGRAKIRKQDVFQRQNVHLMTRVATDDWGRPQLVQFHNIDIHCHSDMQRLLSSFPRGPFQRRNFCVVYA